MHRLALAAALLSSGCAFIYHAQFDHVNHYGCASWSGPSVVDLALGTAGATAMMIAGEYRKTPALFAIPAVFLLDGGYYAIREYSCRHEGTASTPSASDNPTAFDWSAYPACEIDRASECGARSTCTLVDATHARCMPD